MKKKPVKEIVPNFTEEWTVALRKSELKDYIDRIVPTTPLKVVYQKKANGKSTSEFAFRIDHSTQPDDVIEIKKDVAPVIVKDDEEGSEPVEIQMEEITFLDLHLREATEALKL